MWGWVLPTAQPAPLSATLSPALSVYLCANVGPRGPLVVRLPTPFVPHSASLSPATATRVLSTLVPSPPLLPVWMNVYFVFPWCRTPLPFDFLSVLVVRGGAVCVPTPPSWFSNFWFSAPCLPVSLLQSPFLVPPFLLLSELEQAL